MKKYDSTKLELNGMTMTMCLKATGRVATLETRDWVKSEGGNKGTTVCKRDKKTGRVVTMFIQVSVIRFDLYAVHQALKSRSSILLFNDHLDVVIIVISVMHFWVSGVLTMVESGGGWYTQTKYSKFMLPLS